MTDKQVHDAIAKNRRLIANRHDHEQLLRRAQDLLESSWMTILRSRALILMCDQELRRCNSLTK